MKALKKYEYMSPETEILSLETGIILQEISPEGPPAPNQGDPGAPGGGFGTAPWRF